MTRGEVRIYQFEAPDKKRPVVLLTRTAFIAVLGTVTVAPITSSIRDSPSQVVIDETDGMKFKCSVNLHQIMTVPKSKLGKRIANLSRERMRQISEAVQFSLALDDDLSDVDAD